MKVTRRELDAEAVTRATQGWDNTCPRSPGVHASDIWRSLEESLGKYRDQDEGDAEFIKRRGAYRLGGHLWERSFERILAEMMAESGREEEAGRYLLCSREGIEWERDGITGSPDILDLKEERVLDAKCTWKSSGKLEAIEKEFWGWKIQQQAYCAMTRYERGGVRVFCVNGDYRGSGPQLIGLDFEFTRQEVEETWKMLTSRARKLGLIPTAGAAGTRSTPSRK